MRKFNLPLFLSFIIATSCVAPLTNSKLSEHRQSINDICCLPPLVYVERSRIGFDTVYAEDIQTASTNLRLGLQSVFEDNFKFHVYEDSALPNSMYFKSIHNLFLALDTSYDLDDIIIDSTFLSTLNRGNYQYFVITSLTGSSTSKGSAAVGVAAGVALGVLTGVAIIPTQGTSALRSVIIDKQSARPLYYSKAYQQKSALNEEVTTDQLYKIFNPFLYPK